MTVPKDRDVSVAETTTAGAELDSVLAWAHAELTRAGLWSPTRDLEHLTAHVFAESTQTRRNRSINDAAETLRALVKRRATHEPLEYLTGAVDVGGVRLGIGPGTFVPRRQSESVVQWGLRAISDRDRPVVVDLCTGIGAIAIALASERPDATVVAVDNDRKALRWARSNRSVLPADREGGALDVVWGDVSNPNLLECLTGSVDLLLANPPYLADDTSDLAKEWVDHHPYRALYGGVDGLSVVRHVVRRAKTLLRCPGGAVAIEHDIEQATAVAGLLGASPAFSGIATRPDQSGRPRFTVAQAVGP